MKRPDLSVSRMHALARRIEKSNPADTREQGEIHGCLKELHEALRSAKEQELARHVEAAGLLSSYLARMGELAGREVIDIAVRLLRTAAGLKADQAHRLRVGKRRSNGKPDSKPVDAKDVVDDMLLGQILLRRGYVTEEEIDASVQLQNLRKIRFGEAVIELGFASWEQVVEALNYQDACMQLRASAREKSGGRTPVYSEIETLEAKSLRLVSDIMLGQVMLERGMISQKALDTALASQRASGMRIGEALVQTGACTWDQVEAGLRLQAQRRKYR